MNKKIIMMLFFAFAALNSSTAQTTTNQLETKQLQKIESQRIESRIREIYEMDKSKLTAQEKNALKSEVKALKARVNSSGGIYISAGALLIVILLLILFL